MVPVIGRLNPIELILALLYFFGQPDFLRSESMVSMKELLAVSVGLAQKGGIRAREIHEVYYSGEDEGNKMAMSAVDADELCASGDLESYREIFNGFSNLYPGLKVISEEHEITPAVDFNEASPVDLKLPEVDEVIESDQSIPASRVVIWIGPLDAADEYPDSAVAYVTVMVCVAVDGEPKIGVINRPFQGETVWAWDGYGHSKNLVKSNKTETEKKDDMYSILMPSLQRDYVEELNDKVFGGNLSLLAAEGAGYMAMEVSNGSQDSQDAFTHLTPTKKWNICAGNAILNAMGGKMTTLDGDFIDYSPNLTPENDRGLLATLSENIHSEFMEKFAEEAKEKMGL